MLTKTQAKIKGAMISYLQRPHAFAVVRFDVYTGYYVSKLSDILPDVMSGIIHIDQIEALYKNSESLNVEELLEKLKKIIDYI